MECRRESCLGNFDCLYELHPVSPHVALGREEIDSGNATWDREPTALRPWAGLSASAAGESID